MTGLARLVTLIALTAALSGIADAQPTERAARVGLIVTTPALKART